MIGIPQSIIGHPLYALTDHVSGEHRSLEGGFRFRWITVIAHIASCQAEGSRSTSWWVRQDIVKALYIHLCRGCEEIDYLREA